MKCLITGASGFIGSHLVEMCAALGYEIRAFVHYNSRNSWGWLEKLPCVDAVEVVLGDIRDHDSVRSATKGCDSVFHLAALIGIPYSYVSPLAYVKTNVQGTYNVLQASLDHDVKSVVITSTSETYGTAQSIPINEEHPQVGQSPYSATKIAADQLAISYHKSFGLPVKIIRPFNVYGPRQSDRAIIPTIVSQLLQEDVLHLGNLQPTRDFTYVKDTVAAFVEIGKSMASVGTITNVGMNAEISIQSLANLIGEIVGKKIQIDPDAVRVRPAESEVDRLRCDNTRILTATEWQPKYTLRSGLEETIQWIARNLAEYRHETYGL